MNFFARLKATAIQSSFSSSSSSCDPLHTGMPCLRFDIDRNPATAYASAYASNQGPTMAELERHVRLFRNGRNQALRIPREFEFEGDEAIVRKEGDRLIVEPVRKGRLLALLGSLEPLDESFPDVDEDLVPLDDVDL